MAESMKAMKSSKGTVAVDLFSRTDTLAGTIWGQTVCSIYRVARYTRQSQLLKGEQLRLN